VDKNNRLGLLNRFS